MGVGGTGRAHVDLLDLGEGTSIEANVFAEAVTPRLNHGTDHVNRELRRGQVGWRVCEVHGRQLDHVEEVVAENDVDGRRANPLDLVGGAVVVAHGSTVAVG